MSHVARIELTEPQMRALLTELKLVLNPPMYAKVEKMHGELLELRERESVSRFLGANEPEYV
jgi:hypothetical protein